MSDKEWTIMIYMAGDNNLSVDMAYAMEQIKSVAADGVESPNLFVYYDGNSPAIPTLYCDFTDPHKPKYVRSYKVDDKLYYVPAKPNENAADWRSVVNFVDWCVNRVEVDNGGKTTHGRRARRYALIFSGHSLGFQDIGLFKDETSGKSLKMEDLYKGLIRIVSEKKVLEDVAEDCALEGELYDRLTKKLLGQKLDILGFDSCVMGMLEVGYQFREVAETMIASEGSVPSAGWTYAKILGCLTRGKENKYGGGGAKKVAERFVRQFIESQDSYTVGGVSVDLAAWDLGQMDDLADEFDSLSEALVECFRDEGSRLYERMERAVLMVHWKCQSYMYDQNVDLGDFCELLDRECALIADDLDGDELERLKEVRARCEDVSRRLRRMVILSGFSGGLYQYSNGISVFFPWSREGYEVSRKNYEGLWFAKNATRKQFYWAGFLKKYLYEVARRKVEPATPDAPLGERYRYNSGIRFAESVTSAALAGQGVLKMAGQEGSKMAGQEGSKMAGQEGSKMAGQEGSKMAGQEGSKMAGQEGSKLGGGSGANAFYDHLRLFKNIESRWDISGFTKRPAGHAPETGNGDG
jgi:hypothetical protein